MKKLLRPALFTLLLLAAVLIGLMLGRGDGLAGLWADLRGLSARAAPTLDPNDPVLQAGLPKPDPLAGVPDGPLNELLNPDLTPEQQTSVVAQLLTHYWTTVRSLPTGSTWEEIREQLTGRNPKQLALVPPDHPALATNTFRRSPNEPGIHLHVISSSGCAFQLIYEGPDQLPFTEDDLVRNVPPDLKFE